jgi:hypothetical protein
MLTPNSLAEVAPARTRSGMGTCLACGELPVPRDQIRELPALPMAPIASAKQGTSMPFARPQARKDVFLFGSDAQAAGQVDLTRQQRTSNVKYAHTTRIATKGGGSLGPHPARDPV